MSPACPMALAAILIGGAAAAAPSLPGPAFARFASASALTAACDAAFKDDRLDPVVGTRYRRTVLSQGRQLPPRKLVREFLGRETNSKAFFDDLAR